MKTTELLRLEASEGYYLTDGNIISKKVTCLTSARDTFREITDEEAEPLIKAREEQRKQQRKEMEKLRR